MNHLREIRKSRGLTMKQLGKMVGVTEAAIGNYETGKREISYEMLLKLGEALGCEVTDIIKSKKIPATENDDGMQSTMMLDLSKLDEDQRNAIRDILRMTKQQRAVVVPMLESLVSEQ